MTPPQLQPPGAGLPLIPRLYVRWLGRRVLRWKYNWDSAPAVIESTATRLATAADALPDEILCRPVLIPPLTGIEDSSRCWSPAMVLQHLTITGEIFAAVILKLSRGEAVSDPRGPADVKPSPSANRADVAEFRALHAAVGPRLLAEAGADREGPRFRHPWFGPLTARDWLGLFAAHLLIHEKQWHAILRAGSAERI